MGDSPFPQDLDDYIMICADLLYEQLAKTYDNFNRQLKGYFIILGVNSEYPIYHPGILKDDYYNDITRVEFSIHGRHYIYQVTEFKEKILPILTKEYSENDVYTSSNNQPSQQRTSLMHQHQSRSDPSTCNPPLHHGTRSF